MRRLLIRALIYGSLAVAALMVWKKWHPQNSDAIPAAGGVSMSLRLPESGPRFLQRDPQWCDDKVGSSIETLGEVGCTVCSVAMAANALGEHTTPKDLNAALTKNGGYTRDGWLVWGKVGEALGNRVEAVIADRPSHAGMDRALQHGDYPIVKILLNGIVPHWVVIMGKEGTEYLVRDPLESAAEPLRLSAQASMIQSVRYVRKVERR